MIRMFTGPRGIAPPGAGWGDLSDMEWARLDMHLPKNVVRAGRWKSHRTIINGISLRQRTGIPWRDLPVRPRSFDRSPGPYPRSPPDRRASADTSGLPVRRQRLQLAPKPEVPAEASVGAHNSRALGPRRGHQVRQESIRHSWHGHWCRDPAVDPSAIRRQPVAALAPEDAKVTG